MSSVTISGKAIGARKPLFADWSLPIPPDWTREGGTTLRDLISHVVRAEVQAFRQRQEDRRTFHVLTARQIELGAEQGKIEMGGSEIAPQLVDEEEAIAVACQAFEDGIYLVAIDNEDCRQLDREIHIHQDSRVTFVRLALLAGG